MSKEEFEYTKGTIRIRKSKDRQHNGQKKKGQEDKQRSQKLTHKIKDRVTRTLVIAEGKLRFFGKVNSSYSTSGTRCVSVNMINMKQNRLC